MSFKVLSLSIELARIVREPLRLIRREDRDLANQLRRAVNSIALNLSEGRQRDGRDRVHRIAAGSADESRTALQLALAWEYAPSSALESALARLEDIISILWRLTHPK